mmetsp:Transcript_21306/g.29877  ORF Transcript_21306/g.29877 Transcript_21306/m.29877 type:complete len:121 (-) Transcript_21306:162-524(-)
MEWTIYTRTKSFLHVVCSSNYCQENKVQYFINHNNNENDVVLTLKRICIEWVYSFDNLTSRLDSKAERYIILVQQVMKFLRKEFLKLESEKRNVSIPSVVIPSVKMHVCITVGNNNFGCG